MIEGSFTLDITSTIVDSNGQVSGYDVQASQAINPRAVGSVSQEDGASGSPEPGTGPGESLESILSSAVNWPSGVTVLVREGTVSLKGEKSWEITLLTHSSSLADSVSLAIGASNLFNDPYGGGGGLAEAQLEAPQISIDLLSTTEDSDAKIELSFLGATAQVAYDASAQQLRHVLESMPSIGSVDVTSSHSLAVSGTWWWTVTFLETGDPAHLHDIELIAATILPPYEDTWQVDVNEVVAGFAEADEIRVFANDYGKSSHGEVPWDKDGSAYVSRSFNVYASPVADFPYIISAPGSRHRVLDIEEDTPFAMKEIDVNIEFVDDNVYGISASVTIQLICEHGSFTMKSVEGDVISGKTIVVSRTVNDLNAMLATTVYTPDPDWHGFEEITLKKPR